MRRRVVWLASGSLLLLFGATVGLAAQIPHRSVLGIACPVISCPGLLKFDVGGSITPRKRAGREFVPVKLKVHGEIGTKTGGHPSALREAVVEIAEGLAVRTSGLATCRRRKLESASVSLARRKCRKAIVGAGQARVGFASTGDVAATTLTLFNGGTSDRLTRMFVHASAGLRNSTPVVATAKVRRRHSNLEAVLRIPPIAQGNGSLLNFDFELDRRFARRGIERSYLNASCPDGGIVATFSKLLFRNEAKVPGTAPQTVLKGKLAFPCTATG